MRREVKIGIFAVLMIGALWAGIRFLKGFDIFSRNAVYYAAYDQVDGAIWNDIQEAFVGEDVEVLNIGDSVRARRIIDGTDAGRHMVLNTLERLNYL